MMMRTGFFHDERCLWHSGGNYAGMLPVGGHVQPAAAGGLPENPETKRRFVNLMNVTGLAKELHWSSAPPATTEDLLRVHPASYLDTFREMSAAGGGELGLRTPFGPDGYDIAALSAGLTKDALAAVLNGELTQAYALSRPPGHHCLPNFPNGFCLMANIAIAVEAALAHKLTDRVAVLDWDVHHGNGTEAIFYDRPDVFTISIHQERNYPSDTGAFADQGNGKGDGANLNIPLPPGGGHKAYIETMERLVLPALARFKPDVLIIACGFDAAVIDPLGRMMARAETFRAMTQMVQQAARDHCDGRLMMAHEGGYSEVYVPFCGHAVMEQLTGSTIHVPDPFEERFRDRQPGAPFDAFVSGLIGDMAQALGF